MAFDAMTDSALFQLEKYLSSNPYREYAMNKPYIPKSASRSAHSHRLNQQNKSSFIAFHQLMNNQKNPSITLDRIAYKLRIKSDLNVDTLKEIHNRHHYSYQSKFHKNPNINDRFSINTPTVTTKTFTRQPTAMTMTTNSIKTINNDELNGIEGNSIHVGTLHDLIKQYDQAEFHLIHHPSDYLDNISTYTSNNRLTNDRTLSKTSERIIKQPQALTQYHLNIPLSSQTCQYQIKKSKNNLNFPNVNNQKLNLYKQQSTNINSHNKRIQESRVKTLINSDKPICICNKVTIIDPFNSEENSLSKQISTRYIFPPMRSLGYFTRKSMDDITRSTPLSSKKKYQIKKKQDRKTNNSFDSLNQISTDDDDDDDDSDENAQLFHNKMKTTVSLTDLDDELQNPPNTIINIDLQEDKQS